MRVAYLINQYPMVSHTFIRREIQALERRGIEVIRISLRAWDAKLVDHDDQVERKRTRYVLREGFVSFSLSVISMLLTHPVRFLRAFSLACRMSRNAERPLPIHLAYFAEACLIGSWLRTADVKHLHAHFGTNSAEVAMLVHSLGGPPWSFTIHGPNEFNKPEFIGLAEKVRRCSFVIAISSYGRSQLYRFVEHQQWPKVKVVHCGIDPAFFASTDNSLPQARRLICVGRLCEQKGQLLLVEAASRLAANEPDFSLVLAGDGEMREDIETRIANYGLKDKVHITGWISGQQVRDQIRAACALVSASFAEGLPVVIMEAMALQRPIIGTYVAGVPELVVPGEHGWLVPAGDVEALVEAIRSCIHTPTERLVRMGATARKRVLARHNVDTEAAKLASLFRGPH